MRIAKAGYDTIEAPLNPFDATYPLDPAGSAPDGMVRVARSAVGLPGSLPDLRDFWIDKFEVTNRQFKTFVDAGGYRREDLWKQPFVENGRTLPWDEAMSQVPRQDRPPRAVHVGAGYVSAGRGRTCRLAG